jgi:hypothetical protein
VVCPGEWRSAGGVRGSRGANGGRGAGCERVGGGGRGRGARSTRAVDHASLLRHVSTLPAPKPPVRISVRYRTRILDFFEKRQALPKQVQRSRAEIEQRYYPIEMHEIVLPQFFQPCKKKSQARSVAISETLAATVHALKLLASIFLFQCR